MMRLLYTLGIYAYAFLIRLASPFNAKAKQWLQGRKNVLGSLEQQLQGDSAPIVWMHVSSLGEFEQGRPLIEKIKENYPQYKIILTFFSPSGYEIRKNYELADVVSYLPIDTAKNAKRFFEIVKPSKVFFVKYDFWYYYLRESHLQNVPTYLISALFRENQLFFKSYGRFYRKILHFFTIIFVQDESSKDLLQSIDYNDVVVAGDTRVDRVVSLAEQVKENAIVADFKADKDLLVVGSSWQPDEEILVAFLQEYLVENSLKIVIAPHEVHRTHIEHLKKQLRSAQISYKCYSELPGQNHKEDFDVLLVDCIGILSSLYQYADVAYIGGGFGAGIHNTLEPATFGIPIVFGEKYKKFSEAVALVQNKGAFSFSDFSEFELIMQKILRDKMSRKDAGAVCKSFVDKQKGAVLVILSSCFSEDC